jgi:hypothetical protein
MAVSFAGRLAAAIVRMIVSLAMLSAAVAPVVAQQNEQMGSGRTVREFLAALDQGDIDGALAKWVANPEVELYTGERYTTLDEVRAYFETFPRPVEVRDTLPWGGRRFEARVLAGGTPLLLTFQGADGAIAYMYVEPDLDAESVMEPVE